MKAAVIGHPITQSKSPLIHQYWLNQYDIFGSYEALDIQAQDLVLSVKEMIIAGYTGFNVTIPHKQNIMKICDEVDDVAKEIGAVNTVIIKNKKLFGTNTDAFGFIENVKLSHPKFNFKDASVFVLGAGGASRAVVYGLLKQGVKSIKISNRTIEKAQQIQEMSPDIIDVILWDDCSKSLENIDFLVNTTALGMAGKPTLGIDLKVLPIKALVSDIVYTPLMTDLLKQAEARENGIVTGIGMLIHQARGAFKCWTGVLPTVTEELEQQILI